MAAVTYPVGLPCPQTSIVTPAERRALSQADRPREARNIQRDRLEFERITWPPLDADESQSLLTWWRDTLVMGGAWFAATWPLPRGMVQAVRKLREQPKWNYVPGGFWRLSALCEVRGRGLVPDNPYVNCDLLLHFDEAAASSWRDYSHNRRAITIHPQSGSIAGVAGGAFGRGGRFTQAFPGSQSSDHYDDHSYLRAAGNINFGAEEFLIDVALNMDAGLPPTSTSYFLVDNLDTSPLGGWYLNVQTDGAGVTRFVANFRGTSFNRQVSAEIDALDGLTRWRVSRDGDLLTLFKNGVNIDQIGFGAAEAILPTARGFLRIGAQGLTNDSSQLIQGFDGLVDELYVNHGAGIGVSSNFTPPTQPYGG